MGIKSTIPLTWDVHWVVDRLREAGITNDFGWQEESDDQGNGVYSLYYRGEWFETVKEEIDAYPTVYAQEVLRPAMLEQISATRWEKQQIAKFNGMPLPADDATVSRITAAAYLMDADPNSPQVRRWKAGANIWIDVDRNTLVAMGTAIANHMQRCFDEEERLQGLIYAAKNVDELNAIDIESGWP